MAYKSEELIQNLKRVRVDAGLSQRDLSAAAGLTQSHISQIERGMLEPGLSSFIDLARALDHELVLVPKKVLPAVRAVVQGAAPAQAMLPTNNQIAVMNRIQRLLKKLKALHGSSVELDQIDDSLRQLRHMPMATDDLAMLAKQHDVLKRIPADADGVEAIKNIANQFRDLRSRLARTRDLNEPRPAYAFDDGDADA